MDTPPAQSSKKISVFLVDDHPIVCQGLTSLINTTDDIYVCGQASSVAEGLKQVAATAPSVVLVDVVLPDGNGVDFVARVRELLPETRCIGLSMYDETMYALRVLQAGGRGYLMKQEVPKTLLNSIRRVHAGHIVLGPALSNRVLEFSVRATGGEPTISSELSERESEILQHIGNGLSTREIAERLLISIKTVEAHRERIKDKLKLINGTELTRYAMQWARDHAVPS